MQSCFYFDWNTTCMHSMKNVIVNNLSTWTLRWPFGITKLYTKQFGNSPAASSRPVFTYETLVRKKFLYNKCISFENISNYNVYVPIWSDRVIFIRFTARVIKLDNFNAELSNRLVKHKANIYCNSKSFLRPGRQPGTSGLPGEFIRQRKWATYVL